jgi:hypothetical protein
MISIQLREAGNCSERLREISFDFSGGGESSSSTLQVHCMFFAPSQFNSKYFWLCFTGPSSALCSRILFPTFFPPRCIYIPFSGDGIVLVILPTFLLRLTNPFSTHVFRSSSPRHFPNLHSAQACKGKRLGHLPTNCLVRLFVPCSRRRPHTHSLLHSDVFQGQPRCPITPVHQTIQHSSAFPRISSSDGDKLSLGKRAAADVWLRIACCLRPAPRDRNISDQDLDSLGFSCWSHGSIESCGFDVCHSVICLNISRTNVDKFDNGRSFVCTVQKHFIGGFRPYYIEACQPDWDAIVEGLDHNIHGFNATLCLGNPRDVDRAYVSLSSPLRSVEADTLTLRTDSRLFRAAMLPVHSQLQSSLLFT